MKKLLLLTALLFTTFCCVEGCAVNEEPTDPVRKWKVEAVNPYGEVMDTWTVEKRSKPRPDYRTWGVRIWDTHIEAPIGYLLRVTEIEE